METGLLFFAFQEGPEPQRQWPREHTIRKAHETATVELRGATHFAMMPVLLLRP